MTDNTDKKSKNDMLAAIFRDIGHDFKSPLTAMIGSLEMLTQNRASLRPDQQDMLCTISLTEAQRLLHFVENMMTYLRLTQGQVDTEPDRQSCSLQNIIRQAQQQAQKMHRSLQVNLIGNDPILDVEPRMLIQVFFQLLDNAARHNPGKEITVSITTAHEAQGITTLVITDNGAGIPVREKAAIFSPYNTDMATKNKSAAAGLGLTISRLLVEKCKGTLDLIDQAPSSEGYIPAAFRIIMPNGK